MNAWQSVPFAAEELQRYCKYVVYCVCIICVTGKYLCSVFYLGCANSYHLRNVCSIMLCVDWQG